MKNQNPEIFSQTLKIFSSTYISEDNEEIHRQYISIKKTLNSNPSFQLQSVLNKEFCLYEEECKVIETQTSFLFKDDWNTVSNKDDILIQTNKTPQQFLIKVQFSVIFDPLKIFSVLYESDFIEDWMKTIESSRTLETTSIYRKKVQNFYNLPWPLNNRHSILNVRYYPISLLNTILITSYTPKENFENPVNKGKYIEMVLPSASSWIKFNENNCTVVIILQANKYIVCST